MKSIIKPIKATIFTAWLAIYTLLRASVVVVPLILIVSGLWVWAVVFIVLWVIIFGILDAI